MLRSFLSLLIAVGVLAAAEPADFILSARWVVTADGTHRVIDNGAVAVRGERIVAAGTKAEIDRQYKPKQRLDMPQGILIPGLISTHTHAPMSLLRGIADDLRLQEWLEKFIFPLEAKFVSPAFVRDGTKLACAEMMLSGTTTYTDMYYFEEAIAEATKECGMRAVLGQTVIQFPVADAKTPKEGLARTEAFFRKYDKDPLIVPAVAPHALYTNDEATLKAARELANRYGKPLVIHLSETKKENDDMQAKYGASPTAVLDRWGVLNGRTVAAHGVWVSEADMKILKDRGVGVAHCPSSNMKLASGVAPVVRYLETGVAVGLGPDGPAGSNNDFNLFEEMDLATKLQKVSRMDPTALPAEAVFRMATIDGARALGMEKEIGSIEVGKRADLVFVSTSEPHGLPMFNVYSALVYALKGSDVQHVLINGKLVVRGRQPLTLNLPVVLDAARRWQERIRPVH
jgi:5-methylthioadenosine/S-adenosylhomocysteine deaminase